MKYYLWVRWSDKCKEAFEITKCSANWIEEMRGDDYSHGLYQFSTPSGKWLKINLMKALAFKIMTRETNPLEDEVLYNNPTN